MKYYDHKHGVYFIWRNPTDFCLFGLLYKCYGNGNKPFCVLNAYLNSARVHTSNLLPTHHLITNLKTHKIFRSEEFTGGPFTKRVEPSKGRWVNNQDIRQANKENFIN